MEQSIQAPEAASAETQEILKQLEKEGHTVAGHEPKEEPKVEPKKVEPAAKPEEKPEEPEQPEGKPAPERTPKFVPVGKFNELRHDLQEAKRQLEEERAARVAEKGNNSPTSTTENIEDVNTAAKALAEKHEIDEELAKELLETTTKIASAKVALPKDLEQKLASFDQMRAQQEQATLEAAQEVGYNNEFAEVLKEFPELEGHKDKLKVPAFAEGNEKTPLRLLAIAYIHDNLKSGSKSAEKPLHGSKFASAEIVDFENITEDQVNSMSREQFDKYMVFLETKTKK